MKKVFFAIFLILGFVFVPCFAQEKHDIVLKESETYLFLLNSPILDLTSSNEDAFKTDILTTLYNERTQVMVKPLKEGRYRLYFNLQNDDYIVFKVNITSKEYENYDIVNSHLLKTILKIDKVNTQKNEKRDLKFELDEPPILKPVLRGVVQ